MMQENVVEKRRPPELDLLLDDEDFVFDEHYLYCSILGRGAFGVVVEGISKSTLESVAIKIIEKNRIPHEEKDRVIAEAEMLRRLDHANIVRFIKLHISENKVYLATERLQGGSLDELLRGMKQKNKKMQDYQASQIMKGILEAVSYIHSFDIAHRDLKPENILFAKRDDLCSLKLVDFGLSDRYHHSENYLC